eukprot:2508035-Amphidinium_carterae.1
MFGLFACHDISAVGIAVFVISLGPTMVQLGCYKALLEHEPHWRWLQNYGRDAALTLLREHENSASMKRLGHLMRVIVRARLKCRHAKCAEDVLPLSAIARQIIHVTGSHPQLVYNMSSEMAHVAAVCLFSICSTMRPSAPTSATTH